MSLLYKKRVLAAKIETTPGTAETLAAGDCLFVFDPIMQAEIPPTNRVATGSLSRLASVPGARKGNIKFNVELAGSGTATDPLWASVLLSACGMVGSSHAYSFTSTISNYKTLTIGVYEHGLRKVMTGAMGTVTLKAQSGQPGMLEFSFDGIWGAPTDTSMLTLPTYTMVPPRFASSTFTIGAVSPAIASFELGFNNTIKLVEDITKASGYSRALITDRDVRGKIDPEADTVANYDPFGDWIAGTERALSLAVGSATWNVITLAASRFQVINAQEGNRDQLVTHDLDYTLNATSAGENELTLTLS